MSTPTIAYVSAVATRDVEEDMTPLVSALREGGAEVTIAESDAARPADVVEFVVKPAVGAGSRDAQRFAAAVVNAAKG